MPEDPDPLRFSTDKELLVRLAREKGLTDEQITRKLSAGETYPNVLEIAKKWSPHLGISVGEFLNYARRGPGRR